LAKRPGEDGEYAVVRKATGDRVRWSNKKRKKLERAIRTLGDKK
jgi:hypothetical protein